MDLKTFGENDFDPKKWINKAWSTSGNQDKETFVANTVTRLQLYMKQLTNSLDETTTQIVTSIPRILQDASALQVEGAMLQQRMLSLEMKVQGVEEQTGHSIESLQRIDQLKSRLETAASTLREADKWAALATALEDVLESGVPTQTEKLNELAGQVAAMTASLEVLNDAPDYEKKRLQLETLYNRLEAAVSPPLIEALTVMDAAKTATYASVFAGMSRGPSAARCWCRAAGARLAAAWAATDRPGAAALTSLLQGDAARQVEWLTNVLDSKTPLTELITLYTDLLLSLEPSPTKVVSANLKLCSTPDEVIAQLTDLRTDIDAFVAGIRAVMDAPRQNAETVPPQVVLEFGRAAYAPLRSHLPRLSEALSQKLLAQLDSGPPVDQEDLLEYSRALLATAERCHGWLQAARAAALSAAGPAAWPYLAPAVESVCAAMSSRISSSSRRASEAVAAAAGGVLANSFPAALAAEAAAAVMLDTLAAWAEDGEDDPAPDHPLLDLPLLLLTKESRATLLSTKTESPPSAAALRRAKDNLRSLARVILRQPVDAQLDKIPQLPVWSNNDALSTDLPDFALSPQEYITEIGQYLMTLPQHLEMHLSEKQAPLQFLSEVCTHTCEVYAEKILNIRNMDALGTKRCLTDIVYLSSVVEDLGTNITPALRNLEKTLRAATTGPSEKSNMDQ